MCILLDAIRERCLLAASICIGSLPAQCNSVAPGGACAASLCKHCSACACRRRFCSARLYVVLEHAMRVCSEGLIGSNLKGALIARLLQAPSWHAILKKLHGMLRSSMEGGAHLVVGRGRLTCKRVLTCVLYCTWSRQACQAADNCPCHSLPTAPCSFFFSSALCPAHSRHVAKAANSVLLVRRCSELTTLALQSAAQHELLLAAYQSLNSLLIDSQGPET